MNTMYLEVGVLDPQSPEYKLASTFCKGGGGSAEVEETFQEKAAAEVAMKRYKRYADVYRPFEEAAFGEMTDKTGALRFKEKVKGQMNANQAQMLSTGMPRGVDPSLGGVKAALGDRKVSQDFARTMSRAEGLDREQRIAGLQAAINVGTGQANDVQVTSDRLARAALDESINNAYTNFYDRNSKLNERMAYMGMASRVGQQAYTNYMKLPQAVSPSGALNWNRFNWTDEEMAG